MNTKTNIVNNFSDTPIQRSSKNESSNTEAKPAQQVQLDTSSTQVDSPLLYASKEIFKETYKLMHQEEASDAQGISDTMSKEIDKFSNIAMAQGVSANHVQISRYILCTFIDEMFSGSKWGESNDWAGHNLLNRYFKEGYGGDKFFDLLPKFEAEPTAFIHVMELCYVCLSFGYGGLYKQKKNSIQDLGAIKENLYRQIKTTKPKKEKFYANHPAAQRHHKLYSKLSRKIILAVALVLMVVIYAVFSYTVQNNETALIEVIQQEHEKMKGKHEQ